MSLTLYIVTTGSLLKNVRRMSCNSILVCSTYSSISTFSTTVSLETSSIYSRYLPYPAMSASPAKRADWIRAPQRETESLIHSNRPPFSIQRSFHETSLVFLFVRRFLSHMGTVIVHSRMTRHGLIDCHLHHSRDGVFATPASAATYSLSRRRNSTVVPKLGKESSIFADMTQDLSVQEKSEGRSYPPSSCAPRITAQLYLCLEHAIMIMESGTTLQAHACSAAQTFKIFQSVESRQRQPTNEQTKKETDRRTRALRWVTSQSVTLKHTLPSIQSIHMAHR